MTAISAKATVGNFAWIMSEGWDTSGRRQAQGVFAAMPIARCEPHK